MSELDQSESALRENISKKGKNAYYYAHGNTPTGPAWDGREEPRLLAVSAEITVTKPLASQFDSFSWLDETKSVKVYVDFENAHEVEDENISLVSGSDSVEFSVLVSQKQYCLNLSPLLNDIESASFKKKSDKFVISLKKACVKSWDKLKK